jgi:hypothetical protein
MSTSISRASSPLEDRIVAQAGDTALLNESTSSRHAAVKPTETALRACRFDVLPTHGALCSTTYQK